MVDPIMEVNVLDSTRTTHGIFDSQPIILCSIISNLSRVHFWVESVVPVSGNFSSTTAARTFRYILPGDSLCSKSYSLAHSTGTIMLVHTWACDCKAYGDNDSHQHHPQQHGNVTNDICHHCPPDPTKKRRSKDSKIIHSTHACIGT